MKFYLKKGQISFKIYLASFILFSVMTTLQQRHTACVSNATFTLPREKTLYSFNSFISMKSCQNTGVCVSENKAHKLLYKKVKITGRYSVLLSLQTNCIAWLSYFQNYQKETFANVRKNFGKFTGKQLCRSLVLNKSEPSGLQFY